MTFRHGKLLRTEEVIAIYHAGRLALVTTLAAVLAGCGLQSSPADALRFQAPPGWKPSPGILGFMQFWRSPDNDHEILMLFRSPTPLQPNEFLNRQDLHGDLKNASITAQRSVRICNGSQSALYIEAVGTSSANGREVEMDSMMSNVGGSTYFAMYARPRDSAPNPMAVAALQELCAKK